MTERRPHWDDELVDAVIHEIGVLRPSPPPLANTAYAVIAAVEDWQVQHARDKVVMVAGNPGTYVEGLEATIARVRQLHYGYDAMDGLRRCGCCGHPWPCLTALALNGGQ